MGRERGLLNITAPLAHTAFIEGGKGKFTRI